MMDEKTLLYLERIEKRFGELSQKLQDPQVLRNVGEARRIAQERRDLEKLVDAYQEYRKIQKDIQQNRQIMEGDDQELRELAEEELRVLLDKERNIEEAIRDLLIPSDPRNEKNVFLEIRAGAGGEEAALFAADLFRMYSRYAERKGYRVELVSKNQTGTGGFKEVILLIEGKAAFRALQYESGVHRVQRVPRTEASGRIHTSTVTVAVLPEADEIEVEIRPEDIRVDLFRASGPGGQNVNKVESAVRITHLPTGIVVQCQDEKSQHKNRSKAMRVLRARLLERYRKEQEEKISQTRRTQVGTGERSEKIRTYNFPQNRVTDHRIGLTFHNLEEILDGNLDELIEKLQAYFHTQTAEAVIGGVPASLA